MKKKIILGLLLIVLLLSGSLLNADSIGQEIKKGNIWQSDEEMYTFLKKIDINKKTKKEKVLFEEGKIRIYLEDTKFNNLFLRNTLLRFIYQEGSPLIASLGNIEINAKRRSSVENNTHTNGDTNYCKIILGYAPLEYWSSGYQPQKKLLVSLTHELSHCLLGKEVFKNGIEWDNQINNKEEINEKINNYLIKQSNKSWVLSRKGEKILNPLIMYHETFADIFSLIYLHNTKILNTKDIDEILKTRETDCLEKIICHYKAYEVSKDINNILSLSEEKIIDIEELFYFANVLAQKVVLGNLEINQPT